MGAIEGENVDVLLKAFSYFTLMTKSLLKNSIPMVFKVILGLVCKTPERILSRKILGHLLLKSCTRTDKTIRQKI